MKKSFKYIISIALFSFVAMGLASCAGDDKFTDTIFPDTGDDLDSTQYTYKFDKWLKDNYLDVYNLDFRYKMQDVGTDMNYNLVPATYSKAVDLAVLSKYLWFDVYKDVVGPNFLKEYGPRIIHLIGSPAYDKSSGTIILGLAEGGIKVSLFRVNELNVNSFESLNEYYFKTMHHEFAHILHQTKSYPTKFNTISVGKYDGTNWSSRKDGVVASLGFTTPYASSAYREDFAETIANYITKTDADWEIIYKLAARGWETAGDDLDDDDADYFCYYYYKNNDATGSKVHFGNARIDAGKGNNFGDDYIYKYCTPDGDSIQAYKGLYQTDAWYMGTAPFNKDDQGDYVSDAKGRPVDKQGYLLENNSRIKIPIQVYEVEDKDGIDGVEALKEKITIASDWLRDEFGVNLDAVRKEVQYRQLNFDIEALRKQVYGN